MIVSLVGRMMYSSSSFDSGSGNDRDLAVDRDLLQAVVRNDRALLGESLDVLGLLGQEALGDQQREVGVHMAQLLELVVQGALDVLPDGVPVRADDHAAAHGAVLGQFRGLDDVLVPAAVIVCAFRDLGHA